MKSHLSVDRQQVMGIGTPPNTETWYPIPHGELLSRTLALAETSGMKLRNENHTVSSDGLRYFGVLDIVNEGPAAQEYGLAIGIRNSHDKRFPAGLCVGSRVMVCSNLAFSGEITLARRHTKNIMADLDWILSEAVGKIGDLRQRQETRIQAYKGREFSDILAHDALIKAVDAKVIPNADIPAILGQWRAPLHPEFAPRTAWSLFNCFTETLKGSNPLDLTSRTVRLHGLMDAFCGLAPVAAA